MYFLIKHDDFLKDYIIMSGIKSAILFKKRCDSEGIYNKKFLKTKINCYGCKITTDFHNKEIPYEDINYFCISVILKAHS